MSTRLARRRRLSFSRLCGDSGQCRCRCLSYYPTSLSLTQQRVEQMYSMIREARPCVLLEKKALRTAILVIFLYRQDIAYLAMALPSPRRRKRDGRSAHVGGSSTWKGRLQGRTKLCSDFGDGSSHLILVTYHFITFIQPELKPQFVILHSASRWCESHRSNYML